MAEFGYTAPQVVKLLCAREKLSDRGINPLLDLVPGREQATSGKRESSERMGAAPPRKVEATAESGSSKSGAKEHGHSARARENTYA
ncbi:hypothetical protein D3C81_1983780 [compost metagenome]